MSMFRRLSRTWRNLFQRAEVEADLDAELRAWVDLLTDQKVNAGMSPAEARRAALLEAGGFEQVKESVRDVRAGNLLETVLRDFQFGARLLAKDRGFTVTAVVMLALGIGACTAVFSAVNAVLLRGLPYADPDRLVTLYEKRPQEDAWTNPVSAPDFLDWREQSTSFESMAAIAHASVTWQSDAGAEQILVSIASPEVFDVLGVRPMLGTGFQNKADLPDGYHAVVLTHGFWQRRFGADPALLGRTITINGSAREVVGILPASFEYPVQDVELFAPLWWQSGDNPSRASHEFYVIGRLKPATTLAAAQVEMDTIASRLEQEYPAENKGHGVNLVSMREVLLGPVQIPLLALQAAAVFVLLIACGNLANLLLARTLKRGQELSIRLAIGAGRARLFRQLLCESLLLAMLGGAAGIAVAYAAVPLLRSLAPPDLAVLGIRNLEVDSAVLAACLLLSICCGVIFGLAPAWRGAGAGVATVLKQSAATGGPRGERLRKLLIAAQIALSVMLLTGGGVFLRSFAALRSVDTGFRSEGVLTVQAALPATRYQQPEQVVRFSSEWMAALRRLPGVEALGLTSHLPVSGADGRTGLAIENVPPADPNQPRRAHIRWVSPGYFQAMGLRIVEGRPFLESDGADSPSAMIVNETAARRYFPDGKALGHRAHRGGVTGPWSEVVGVVADVRHWGLDVDPNPEQYYCHLQQPTWTMNLAIRASGDPRRLTPDIRRELHRMDSLIPLARVQTMEELVSRSIAKERSVLILLSLFAGIALLLTAAGIWGTMAYLLSQRRREIGIRLALGATDGALIRHAVGGAMKLVAAGIIAGVALSLVIVRVSSASFFGVSPTDPLTYAAVPVILGAVALLANYYPARRIMRSTPYRVLREE